LHRGWSPFFPTSIGALRSRANDILTDPGGYAQWRVQMVEGVVPAEKLQADKAVSELRSEEGCHVGSESTGMY